MTESIKQQKRLTFNDDVAGVVVGGDFLELIALESPNGKVQRRGVIDLRDISAEEWFKNEVEGIYGERLGNGKKIKEYPELLESVYGKGADKVEEWKCKAYYL